MDVISKWPIVRVVKNITTEITIGICKKIFMDFGIPKLVIDNGHNFCFHLYMILESGHFKILPRIIHQQTDRQERFVQTLKNSLKKIITDHNNKDITLENAVRNFLVMRNFSTTTLHCVTGIS